MRILKEDTIAIAVDYQEKLMSVIFDSETILKNSEKLLKGLIVLDIPVIVTQQYKKGLGETVHSIKEAVDKKCEYYDKVTFSCADNSEISNKIKEYNKKNIIIIGVESHICVLQTAVDLVQEGYNVILVIDCIGSRKEADKEAAIKRLYSEGVILTTYESILFELMRTSQISVFREISGLIK